jgi:hypothetical protein
MFDRPGGAVASYRRAMETSSHSFNPKICLIQLSRARVDSKVGEIRQRIPEIQSTLLEMVNDKVPSGNND